MMKSTRLTILMVALLLAVSNLSSAKGPTDSKSMKAGRKAVKEACRHAWDGYYTYARGYDALKPVSKTGHNWYPTSLLMTPVDAYDTFILLGMTKEANEAKELIIQHLDFDIDMEVQLFEVSIRLLGGLISAWEMSGEPEFRRLAVDLGQRLLPSFNSATGLPYRFVNLKTGRTRDSISNPAECGTYLLEFGKLTRITGDSIYYLTARRATEEIFRRRSDIDLVGTTIDVNTGEWKNRETQVGARIDSYYEYLYKSWLLFGDVACKTMWEIHATAIKKHLYRKTPHGGYFTRADMLSGKETRPLYGALEAYYAGLLALSGDVSTAREVQEGNFHMWATYNLEPEEFNFITGDVTHAGYPLRPENIESCFYLYRQTGEEKYRSMGRRMTDDILKNCRTDAGYAALKDVRTNALSDMMESFFIAETIKYAYLLHTSEKVADLKKVVFTTEAHPMQINCDRK